MKSISVCILSHNRIHDLHWVIDSVLAQDYPPLEILVVDNGSDSRLLHSIEAKYPTVKLIPLPQNIGVAARTIGIQQAQGDLIVTLDDDVALADADALRTIALEFHRNPNTACLTFSILNPVCYTESKTDWGHPKPFDLASRTEFVSSWFAEGASAFRRSVFSQVESYWSALYFGMEGPELTFRLLEAGKEIRYIPTVRVVHRRSETGRTPERHYFHHTRSLILLASRNIPGKYIPAFLTPRLIFMGILAIRSGAFSSWFSGLRAGIRESFSFRTNRNPISQQTWTHYQKLRRDAPPVTQRISQYVTNHSPRVRMHQPEISDQQVA